MLSKLEFSSLLAYSTKGTQIASKKSKGYRDALKRGNQALIGNVAKALAARASFREWFADDVALVPVPGSSALVRGGLWVPHLIAEALHSQKLGASVSPIILRATAVPKSAYQSAANRPDFAAHFRSLAVDELAPPMERMILVDDVVTSGCTMLAVASRLAERYPDAQIRGFAVMRAMSTLPDGKPVEVEDVLAPCFGDIKPRNGRAVRRP